MYYELNLLAYYQKKNEVWLLFNDLFWKNQRRLFHELTTIRIDTFHIDTFHIDTFRNDKFKINNLAVHTDSFIERNFYEYPICDIV